MACVKAWPTASRCAAALENSSPTCDRSAPLPGVAVCATVPRPLVVVGSSGRSANPNFQGADYGHPVPGCGPWASICSHAQTFGSVERPGPFAPQPRQHGPDSPRRGAAHQIARDKTAHSRPCRRPFQDSTWSGSGRATISSFSTHKGARGQIHLFARPARCHRRALSSTLTAENCGGTCYNLSTKRAKGGRDVII